MLLILGCLDNACEPQKLLNIQSSEPWLLIERLLIEKKCTLVFPTIGKQRTRLIFIFFCQGWVFFKSGNPLGLYFLRSIKFSIPFIFVPKNFRPLIFRHKNFIPLKFPPENFNHKLFRPTSYTISIVFSPNYCLLRFYFSCSMIFIPLRFKLLYVLKL